MSKRSGIPVALIFAAAFFAGCGSSSTPSAPVDTVAPAPVVEVQARVVQGTIEVSWAAGSESDLAGYRVYRSANGADATLEGFTANTTFVDTNVSARHWYRYEVSAMDEAGNESPHTIIMQVVPGSPSHAQISN